MTRSAPVAISQFQTSSRPMFSTLADGSDLRIRVRHREFIADIPGSVNYGVNSFPINPGIPSVFPWLSNVAQNFESYQFRDLCFQYRTESPTSSAGKIILSVDWDAADAAPISKLQQFEERTKAEDAVWANFDLVCDKQDLAKFGTQRYVRNALPLPAVGAVDIKTYDVGNLFVGRQGESGTTVIGELWVCYDIELMTPNVPLVTSEKITAATAISNVQIFGSAPVQTGALIANASVNTLTFPFSGQYAVDMILTGTTPVVTVIGGTATQSATAFNVSSATQNATSVLVNANSLDTLVYTVTGTVTASVVRIMEYPASSLL